MIVNVSKKATEQEIAHVIGRIREADGGDNRSLHSVRYLELTTIARFRRLRESNESDRGTAARNCSLGATMLSKSYCAGRLICIAGSPSRLNVLRKLRSGTPDFAFTIASPRAGYGGFMAFCTISLSNRVCGEG
jgi:hypothetical protein